MLTKKTRSGCAAPGFCLDLPWVGLKDLPGFKNTTGLCIRKNIGELLSQLAAAKKTALVTRAVLQKIYGKLGDLLSSGQDISFFILKGSAIGAFFHAHPGNRYICTGIRYNIHAIFMDP